MILGNEFLWFGWTDALPEQSLMLVPGASAPGGQTTMIVLRVHKPDLSQLFAFITGGRALGFLKKNGLERAIELVSQEVHREYILTFEPKGREPGRFYPIRIVVKDRADLRAKMRAGYFAL